MRLLIPFAFLTACAAEENPEYPPELPLPEEYRACQVDQDCTIVELGLCDHCNGGVSTAVSVDKQADAFEKYHEYEPRGQNWACTEMACAPLEATCNDTLCETREQASVQSGTNR